MGIGGHREILPPERLELGFPSYNRAGTDRVEVGDALRLPNQ